MAVMRQSVFKYKTVKGPLHKLPAIFKFFLLLPLSILCMSLTPPWLALGIIVGLVTGFFCGFTLLEQLTDLKPAALYAFLMYALSVFSLLFENWYTLTLSVLFIPRADFLRISLRLVLIIQLSALLFRSTSSMEIREGLRSVELFVRRCLSRIFSKRISLKCRFAENIALFLSFIPEIFAIWSGINLAWKARGGKNGLAKIRTVVFVLISLSFEKAAAKAKALAARDGYSR